MEALSLWVNPAAVQFDPLQARSLHHQVEAFILKATYEGSLNPGDRLNESTLSAHLGISRTPVREALTYLEGSGLVVRRPRHGFFLAALSAEDAAHCYTVRELLEGYAAGQVAGRMTAAQADALGRIIEAMGRAAGDGDWVQAAVHNIAFHEAVVGLTGNPVLRRMWTSVGPVLWYFDSLTRRAVDPRAKESFVKRHKVLLASLRRNDASAAETAFVSHIAGVKRDVIARLKTSHAGGGQHDIRRGSDNEEPIPRAGGSSARHPVGDSILERRAAPGAAAARPTRARRRPGR